MTARHRLFPPQPCLPPLPLSASHPRRLTSGRDWINTRRTRVDLQMASFNLHLRCAPRTSMRRRCCYWASAPTPLAPFQPFSSLSPACAHTHEREAYTGIDRRTKKCTQWCFFCSTLNCHTRVSPTAQSLSLLFFRPLALSLFTPL